MERNVGIQALWGLTTVAKRPGGKAAGTLKPSHMYMVIKSMCVCNKTFLLDSTMWKNNISIDIKIPAKPTKASNVHKTEVHSPGLTVIYEHSNKE